MAAHERSTASKASFDSGGASTAGINMFGGMLSARQQWAAASLMASLLATALLTMAIRLWQVQSPTGAIMGGNCW